jgi:hypothetical protein
MEKKEFAKKSGHRVTRKEIKSGFLAKLCPFWHLLPAISPTGRIAVLTYVITKNGFDDEQGRKRFKQHLEGTDC